MVVASAFVGLAYAPILGSFLDFEVTFDRCWRFAAQGALLGGFLGFSHLFFFKAGAARWLHRLPLPLEIVVKGTVSTALIALALLLGSALLFPERFDDGAVGLSFLRDILFAFGAMLVLQFVLVVRSVIGGRVLRNLILGRYSRPVREERIFMFLDIAGSTAIAERLGDIGTQSMISHFFFDIAQVTAAFDGETHAYIGDEVIVTWPMAEGLRDNSCLRCCLAIEERIADLAPIYHERFGFVPRYRIGLHGGPVVASVCGDDKREIVYFGDTVNTTARIEQYCKEIDRKLMVSASLFDRLATMPAVAADPVGPVRLRGRAEDTVLYAIERRAQ